MAIDKRLDNLINTQNIYGKIFLFYGDEKYYRDLYINKIKRIYGDLLKGINYISLDDTNALNIISEVNTPAFGYENKLIIINNSNIFKNKRKKKDENNDEIENNEEDSNNEEESLNNVEIDLLAFFETLELPSNVTIIFNENNISKAKKTYKIIDKIGLTIEFKKNTEQENISYICSLCNKYNVKITKDTANYFINICNNSAENIINEVRKLIEYTKSGNEIKKDFIDLITTKNIEAIIFDLTDNLGNKKIKEAIIILDDLLLQKEPLQKIYIMLYKHYRNLYLYKYGKENKIDNLNEILELHPYVATKLSYQIRNYTLDELKKLYKEFVKIDINNKTGNIDLYTGIINVICTFDELK